jgi:hypothetical protein
MQIVLSAPLRLVPCPCSTPPCRRPISVPLCACPWPWTLRSARRARRVTMHRLTAATMAPGSVKLPPRVYWLAGVATLGTLILLRSIRTATTPSNPHVIPSPQDTLLPHLTAEEASRLPYPPDPLPGRRDVPSALGEYPRQRSASRGTY